MHLRTATHADIPALIELVTSAYRGEASRQGWTTEADLLDGQRIDETMLRADIDRPQSLILVAERDRGLLACAHIAIEDGDGYFGMFSVAPGAQGDGIGKTVLSACERLARDTLGCTRLRMTVIDCREELIAYYERRGYRRTGIKKPFPYGDPRYGLPKRGDLRFEILEKQLDGDSA
ncbi:MAG: GNAT family N-acetyltransferase [Lysobacteraceae bacterium]|nr:MAG: GNAT family N-acetyltransferase [Xanthomonadaceae bacterium]